MDSEIAALKRRVATGDSEAWPLLDAALARAGLPPRRVWYVWHATGEYSDYSAGIAEGRCYADKEHARAAMVRLATAEGFDYSGAPYEEDRAYVPDPKDPERYVSPRDDSWRGDMRLQWMELFYKPSTALRPSGVPAPVPALVAPRLTCRYRDCLLSNVNDVVCPHDGTCSCEITCPLCRDSLGLPSMETT